MVFKYDVVTLIELVEARHCLWDKTNECIKNKVLREKCWQEIFSFLEPGYEEMSKGEKKNTGDSIVKKWSNVRDSFIKSLRTKSGQAFQKKYIYADNLNFLLKIAKKAKTESNILCESESSHSTMASMPPSPDNTPEPSASISEALAPTAEPSTSLAESPVNCELPFRRTREKKRTREPDLIEMEILTELKRRANSDANNIPASVYSRPDDKELMLLSFLPYIKDMNETELMDLHMDMLSSIQKIKQKRTLNILIHPSSSPSGSSSFSSHNTYLSQMQFPPSTTVNSEPTVIFTFPNSQELVNEVNNIEKRPVHHVDDNALQQPESKNSNQQF